MKKIFLLLSLLVISIFLVGCSENLAGEAHRSSRTNADSLINSLTEIEQQRCYNAKLRDCPRANEENVYALLARSNVFALDLMMDSKQRNFKSFKKSVNSYLGIIQKVASGEGSSRDKLIAKAVIGQTYASADQADILIMADLIMANHLGITANEMADVNKMPGSDLLKGISKSGPDLGASTGGMGSLIPPGPSQSVPDCIQDVLSQKSGAMPGQAPGGGASDPLMPVGPRGDFPGGTDDMGLGGGQTQDFDMSDCEGLDFSMLPGYGTGMVVPSSLNDLNPDNLEKGDVVLEERTIEDPFYTYEDPETGEISNGELTKVHAITYVIKDEETFEYISYMAEEFTDPSGQPEVVSSSTVTGSGSLDYLKEKMGASSEGFKVLKGGADQFNPNDDPLTNTFCGMMTGMAVVACMEAAGSADICTGLESTGEQGQVAMILENFCNSATGAEIDGSLFDQSVIINPGNMINQAYLINFFGFTQTQLGDLYSQS